MISVLAATIAAAVASLVSVCAGWYFAPKQVTVIHPWPDEERCTCLLSFDTTFQGVGTAQCIYREGHKGVHVAWVLERRIPFHEGLRVGTIGEVT